MQLFVMRHGQANPVGEIDSERALTQQGLNEATVMAHWLKSFDCALDTVLVSPFCRAQQTAEQLINTLEQSPAVSTVSIITPSGSAKQVHDYIDAISESQNIDNLLIVSHMPLVSYLVAELTFDQQSPIFQTAAIAQIDYDVEKMRGTLVKLISPNELS